MIHKPRWHDSEPSLSPFIVAKCRQMVGRLAAIVFLLTFFGLYVLGIIQYGLLLGIGLGWLPAGLVAWFLAFFIAPIADSSFRHAVMEHRCTEELRQLFARDL